MEETYNKLKELQMNAFNTVMNDDTIEETVSDELEHAIFILAATINGNLMLSNVEKRNLWLNKLPALMQIENFSKFSKDNGLYLLSFNIYMHFWNASVHDRNIMEMCKAVENLMQLMDYIGEALQSPRFLDENFASNQKEFMASSLFGMAQVIIEILIRNRSIIPNIIPENIAVRLEVLSNFVACQTFTQHYSNVLPYWTTLMKRLNNFLPPENDFTVNLLMKWLEVQTNTNEVIEMLKKFMDMPRLYVCTIAGTICKLEKKPKDMKNFIKTVVQLYGRSREGAKMLTKDSGAIFLEVVKRQSQIPTPEEDCINNRFEILELLERLIEAVLKDSNVAKDVFDTLTDLEDLLFEEQDIIAKINDRLVRAYANEWDIVLDSFDRN